MRLNHKWHRNFVRLTTWVLAGMTALWLVSPIVARAEYALQILYKFPATSPNPCLPYTKLTEDETGAFFGVSYFGGSSNLGSVFKFAGDGTVTTLASIRGTNGYLPRGGLVRGHDGDYYGIMTYGGEGFAPPISPSPSLLNGYGTIFKVSTNGEVTTLFCFYGTNGSSPNGLLLLAGDGSFYGTTVHGGGNILGHHYSGPGTVFRVTTNGVLSTLVTFPWIDANPYDGLVFGGDGCLYGTTCWGGDSNNGTVFKVTTNGELTTLVSFDGANGRNPFDAPTWSDDGKFFGNTLQGGSNNLGTVFRMTTNGTLTTLFHFDGVHGSYPSGPLVQGKDGNFYGGTSGGGSNNLGTIYRITTNGSLTTLVHIDGTNGIRPSIRMILSRNGNLYGTMADSTVTCGGDNIFRLVQPPTLSVFPGTNGDVNLSWDSFTNGHYRLEYKSALTDTNWSVLAPYLTTTSNSTSFTDSLGGSPSRYYRVVLLP